MTRRSLAMLLLPLFLVPVGRSVALEFSVVGQDVGLRRSTFTAIEQGPDGFLWFGTPRGLIRYDGYEFRVYREGDSGLGGDGITALHRDAHGTLWVGTRYAGLYRYDRLRRTFVPAPTDRPIRGRITALADDAAGDLWVGTSSQGVIRVSSDGRGSTEIVHDPLNRTTLSSGSVTALAADDAGRVYVGTADRGLNIVDIATNVVEVVRHRTGWRDSIPSDEITALLVDRDGRLLVAHRSGDGEGGLGRYVPGDGRYEPIAIATGQFPPVPVALLEDRDGDVWVGIEAGGVLRLRDDVVVGEGLFHAPPRALYEDASGVIWAGTYAGGLAKYVPRAEQFRTALAHRPGTTVTPLHLVWSFAERGDGTVYAGTDRTGLHRYDSATQTAVPVDADLPPGARLLDLFAQPDRLWAAMGVHGAVALDASGAVVRRIPPDARSGFPPVASVYADDAWVYLGTAGSGLIRVEADGSSQRHARGESIRSIAADAEGRLWLGTDGTDLLRYDPRTNAIDRFPIAERPGPGFVVWSIDPAPDGSLWLGAGDGGAILFDPAQGVRLRLRPRDDFDADSVYGVRADGVGGVWFSTDAGLFRVDERTGELQRYTASDGLPADEFSAGAFLRASDGTLYGGTVNGFVRFDPRAVAPSSFAPPMVISSLRLGNGDPVAWEELSSAVTEDGLVRGLTLPPGTTDVTITVASLDYTDPAANTYSYRLVGVDDSWIRAGTHRVITYEGLRPGEYRLYVRGTNSDGVLNRDGLVFDIRVLPRFRQTGWFVAAAVLIGVLVLSVVVFVAVRYEFELTVEP